MADDTYNRFSDIPLVSRNHYGSDAFEDINADNLANFLTGSKEENQKPQTSRPVPDTIDFSFLQRFADEDKYGK